MIKNQCGVCVGGGWWSRYFLWGWRMSAGILRARPIKKVTLYMLPGDCFITQLSPAKTENWPGQPVMMLLQSLNFLDSTNIQVDAKE